MGETYDEVKANKDLANAALKKMKDLEKQHNLYVAKINKNTIVCCKNKDKIKDYKKL